ncbi:MAG TPA: hypothetical protein VLS90_15270 [Thermodesulfobacteriota bacterium]|nr:hypothetical protein [Thermodesulfobacteriota bacterium]
MRGLPLEERPLRGLDETGLTASRSEPYRALKEKMVQLLRVGRVSVDGFA